MNKIEKSLEGKVAIVTGASSGIGKSTAMLLSREGAKVVLADVNTSEGKITLDEIRADGGKALFIATDVSNSENVQNLIRQTIKTFGRIHILFNNAGIDPRAGRIDEIDESTWDNVININLKSAFLCIKYCVPHMIQGGGGAIVNNSSLLSSLVLPGAAAYCTSKAGLIGLTKSAALDLVKFNIRVNAICPGSIDTPLMWSGVSDSNLSMVRKLAEDAEPIGRLGRPDEVAKTVLFLVTENSSFITGAEITVDGGLGSRIATVQ